MVEKETKPSKNIEIIVNFTMPNTGHMSIGERYTREQLITQNIINRSNLIQEGFTITDLQLLRTGAKKVMTSRGKYFLVGMKLRLFERLLNS
ncbi:hypothetical protein KW787_03945 [Candidatus Pacearchaeota archaeon]|nr:hypothetical protein [Candidatus Pacearchaeota archaeon]